MSSLTLEAVLEEARETRAAASKLARPRRLFGWRRSRRFVGTVDQFIEGLHQLRQHEAARVTPEQEAELRELVDAIIEQVERFLASHQADDRDEFERNQHLAGRIYDLRKAFEAIARHATPNPHIIDLRREERLRNAYQPKR